LVGGSDFSLIGRPILSSELVSVHATVIEKALSHIKTIFRKKKRKQYQRINCKHRIGKHLNNCFNH
jgi:large subunit ribosomal protein L21